MCVCVCVCVRERERGVGVYERERGGEREWGVVPAQEIRASVEGKKAHHRHFLSFFYVPGWSTGKQLLPLLISRNAAVENTAGGCRGRKEIAFHYPALSFFFTPQLELANYLWIAQVDRLP